jgi:hypothetical protein
MGRTKDQRDLEQVLEHVRDARDVAYGLFRRRLDTQRNVNAFILLRDAFVCLKEACELLEEATKTASELKSSDQNSVIDEIGVRSGRLKIVGKPERESPPRGKASVLLFRSDKKKGKP